MLRTTMARPFFRSFIQTTSTRPIITAVAIKSSNVSNIHRLSSKRPEALIPVTFPRFTTPVLRYATKAEQPIDQIDKKAEQKVLEKVLKSTPESVTEGSSVRHVLERSNADEENSEMLSGIKTDIVSSCVEFSSIKTLHIN